MKDEKIKKIQDCFMEFIPLYHKKLSLVFHEDDEGDVRCTKNQKRTILLLKKVKGVTATELGRFLDMRKGSLTSLIDSLEENGLVLREPQKSDRRMTLLFLTDAGEEYYRKLVERYTIKYQELFSVLPEAEIDRFLTGIEDVVESMKKI